MVKHKLENIQRWEREVEAWKSSGFSQREYCNQKNISPSTLHGWCHKLKNFKTNNAASPDRFVQMTFSRESAEKLKSMPAQQSGIILSIDDRIKINIDTGFDKNSLSEILNLLNCTK